MSERDELVAMAWSLYSRGYTFGAAGNIGVRIGDRVVISPTNSSFGDLSPDTLAEVTLDGASLAGPRPSKEVPFHLAAYRARSEVRAVVHLHSCHATALGPAVEAAAAKSPAVLLRNHGSITMGRTLKEAAALAEEIEEQAKLYFLLGSRGRALTPSQIAELRLRFP